MKLDLGCGKYKKEGFIGVDVRPWPGVDIVMHIGKEPFPVKDDSIEEINASHFLEHLYSEELSFCMDDCFRVLAPSGFMRVEVPVFPSQFWAMNPDHKIHWTKDMFSFYTVPADGKDIFGYQKGYWHTDIHPESNENVIVATMWPNKIGGKYPYVDVK